MMLGVLTLLLVLGVPGSRQFLSRRTATSFLSRNRRGYQVFEETRQGHLERECVEEFCNQEEAREIFENDPETNYFYPRYQECRARYGPRTKKDSDLDICIRNIPNQCSPNPCYADGSVRCEDLKGDFWCECKQGWTGVTCSVDVDECKPDNNGCAHICTNVKGSYQCTCRTGFRLRPDKHQCSDINECAENARLCGLAHCVNTQGSYRCDCHPGYKYNSSFKTCLDIDECKERICSGGCVNTPGGYSCYCDGKASLKLAADLQSCVSILPCVSLDTMKNEGSLYLGRFFHGTPALGFIFKRERQTRFLMEFDFRSFDTEGTIFQAGQRRKNTWIMLALHSGRLQVQYYTTTEASGVTSGGPVLNDGRWHTISVEESTNNLIVKVAREAVMNINIPQSLFQKILGEFQIDITVGGLFGEGQLVKQINPRLDACLRGWNWMDSEEIIREIIEREESMQCFFQLEKGSFFPGHALASFLLSYDTRLGDGSESWAVHLSATIRPAQDTGVLVALVNESSVPLSLAIMDWNPGTKSVVLAIENVVVYKLDRLPLCGGDKLSIQAIVTKERVTLEVSGMSGSSPLRKPQLTERLSTLDRYLRGSVLTYLGGVPDVPITAAPVTAFYEGCMEVLINNTALDLDEALYKHNNIRSHSCPRPDSAL